MSPDSVRALAMLIEVHLSVRAALVSWPQEVSPEDADDAEGIAALVRLGVAPGEACEAVLGEAGVGLGDVLSRGEMTGGGVSRSVDDLARRLAEERASARARDATAAGAKLSARIVVALPAGAFLVGASRSGLGPATVVALLLGVALVSAGAAWISRLKPSVTDDGADRLATALADSLEGGVSPGEALSRLAREATFADVLAGPRRAVASGALWPEALAASEVATIRRVGRSCLMARRYGRPLAPVLRTIAAAAADTRAAAAERALRRAPIRMVVPLALCVLPGSLLIAVAPLMT